MRMVIAIVGVTGAIKAACASPAATTKPVASPTAAPGTAPPTSTAAATATAATQATPGGEIGPGEGELNLEVATGDEPDASDSASLWVTPFEQQTGCKVNKYDVTDSTNGVSLIQSGAYDGISASSDATTGLIQGGCVAPIDASMLPNYADVFDGRLRR